MNLKNIYHRHQIVSTLDENGWRHELYALDDADQPVGNSLGNFEHLADAIREAKARHRAAEAAAQQAAPEPETNDEAAAPQEGA